MGPLPVSRPDRPAPKLLAGILILGLLLRIWVSFFSHLPNLHRDSQEYIKQADAILSGGYINFFPNGYPFIIAGVKALFPAQSISILVWMQVLMSTAIIYFGYGITKLVAKNERAALVAAVILAIFPSQINYTRWLITEMPTGFFLFGAYFFFYRGWRWWSGLFFGIAIVIRTEMLPVLILIFLLQLFWKGSRGLLAGRKRWDLLFWVGVLVPILFTGGYCYEKTGHFSLAGNGQVNMVLSVTASGSYIDWSYPDHHPEINTSGKALESYFSGLRTDPGGFIKGRWENFWELWGFYPSSADGTRGMGARLVIGFGNLFLVVCGFAGWWPRRGDLSVFILLLPFLLVTGIHIFLFAMQRYTSPVEPYNIVLASVFLASLVGRVHSGVGGVGAAGEAR